METLSIERQNRVRREIKRTERLLEKELSYPPHLQKAEMIAEYKSHITGLYNMLPA